MSTPFRPERRVAGGAWPARAGRAAAPDPADELAFVARARRELLLRVHRHQLRREDLEDCYSQATLELLAHTRRGGRYDGRRHLAAAIEQRFVSRIHDRRRALAGRSPMQAAIEGSLPLGPIGEPELAVADSGAELEALVMIRHDLRRLRDLAPALSFEQRLVLACQVGLQMSGSEFCRRYGWSQEKYRKVAQRGRARLRRLMAEEAAVTVPAPRRRSPQEPAYENYSPHS